MSVLVYVENLQGKFKKSAFEAISYGAKIAADTGGSVTALSIGNVSESALAELGKYGAKKVLNVNKDKLNSFVNQAYAAIIADAAKKENAKIVIISNTFSGVLWNSEEA